MLPLHPNVWQGNGTQTDFPGLDALQQPAMACFASLVSSCSAVLQRLGRGWVQPSPSLLPRSDHRSSVAVLGQFAALQDQTDRKDQRSLGFASSEGAIALVGATGQTWLVQGLLLGLFTSVLPSGSVTGRTALVGSPKHHQPLFTMG